MAKYDNFMQGGELTQLEQHLQDALMNAVKEGSLDNVIRYLSEVFDCERIYIFQKNKVGNYDETYEWCKAGTPHKQHFLQNLHWESCANYYNYFNRDLMLIFSDIEELKETNPSLYSVLRPQNVHSLIVGQLSFYGRDLGFFGVDNIRPDQIPFAKNFLKTLSFFISAMINGQQASLETLQNISRDALTKLQTWHMLFDAMDRMNQNISIGIIYSNMIGMKEINIQRGRQIGDNFLVEVARVFVAVFGEEHVYLIDGDDFVVALENVSKACFVRQAELLKEKLSDLGVAIEIGVYWSDCWIGNAELMLSKAKECKMILSKYGEEGELEISEDLAQIGLYDSDEFFVRANTWLRTLGDEDRRIAMLTVDFDNFMLYNSIFGRNAGNRLLSEAADHLLEYARAFHGVTGYMGGDNFALILPIADLSKEQIAKELKLHIQKYGGKIGFAPSCGVYICDYRNESAAIMYDRALTALSGIKNVYTEHVAFFDEAQFASIRQKQILMMDVNEALRKREFSFYLQPKVNMHNGKIISAEALVRWNKNGQVISPAVFVPQLEENGYIYALDCYIWESVCRYQRNLLDEGIHPLPISVNISQVDFYFDDLAEHFKKLLENYRLQAWMIDLEITESAYAKQQDVVISFVEKVRAMGFKILIDDFGSGYSSLNSVQKLQADVLKIDKQFMDSLESGEKSRTIVSSIVSMARLLGLHVIVEGVETKEQTEILLELDCAYAQGYYFYRPMPSEDYKNLLQMPERVSKRGKERHYASHVGRMSVQNLYERGLMTDELLNRLIGPAAIFEVFGEHIHLFQMNDAYSNMTQLHFWDQEHIHDRFEEILDQFVGKRELVLQAFEKAEATRERTPGSLLRIRHSIHLPDGTDGDFMTTIQPIGVVDEFKFYFVTTEMLL